MGVRRLNIVSCNAVKSGETNGRQWTIYEVAALNADGEHIDQKLRSFSDLPMGDGDYDVVVTEYQGEQQYTLKPGGSGGGAAPSPGARLGPKVDELRKQYEDLAARVLALEARLDLDATPVPDTRVDDDGPVF